MEFGFWCTRCGGIPSRCPWWLTRLLALVTSLPDSRETHAGLYRGLTRRGIVQHLAGLQPVLLSDGTPFNDVLMHWHDSLRDALGKEFLFSDADAACSLEALAGHSDQDAVDQVLVLGNSTQSSSPEAVTTVTCLVAEEVATQWGRGPLTP